MTRTLWADPTPIVPTDTSGIQAKLDQIIADELVDDATAAALKTVVDAIKIPDISGKADKAAVDAAIAVIDAKNAAQDAAIAKNTPADAVTPIYEPIPAPAPLVIYKSSYVAKDNTGTLLVNQGATHTALRTTGAKIVPNSEQVFVVPAAYISTASVKIRFAILTAKVGTLLIELDSAPALTASGDGTAWVSASSSMVVRTEGLWSWFEIIIPSGQNDIYVRFCVPPGVIGAPCLYDAAASTSLLSSVLLGMRFKADGKTLDYRPSDPASTIAALTATTGKPLEIKGCLENWTDYVWVQSVLTLSTSSPGPVPNATVSSDWPAFAVVGGYPGKAGPWLPLNARYQPNTAWFACGSNTYYARRLAIDETITSISYEFTNPADPTEIGSVTYDAATIASWTVQTSWGGYGKFDNIVCSKGTTVKIITCVRKPNRDIVIASMNNLGTVFGQVRNLRINGNYADVLDKDVAQDAAIAANATAIAAVAPKSSSWTTANAGIAVAVGSRLRVQVPTSGNRSLQLSAVSGSIVVSGLTYYNASGAPASISTTLTTTWVYAVSTWNFGTAGSVQTIMLLDANGQKWKITMVIGDSYNNNVFTVEEI
jgi:hypothetical protein